MQRILNWLIFLSQFFLIIIFLVTLIIKNTAIFSLEVKIYFSFFNIRLVVLLYIYNIIMGF